MTAEIDSGTLTVIVLRHSKFNSLTVSQMDKDIFY